MKTPEFDLFRPKHCRNGGNLNSPIQWVLSHQNHHVLHSTSFQRQHHLDSRLVIESNQSPISWLPMRWLQVKFESKLQIKNLKLFFLRANLVTFSTKILGFVQTNLLNVHYLLVESMDEFIYGKRCKSLKLFHHFIQE